MLPRPVKLVINKFSLLTGQCIMALALSGCVNTQITCPDGKSTASYKGISLMGATSVGCTCAAGGGQVATVSGDNILAIASAIAPLIGSVASKKVSGTAGGSCP